MFYKKTFLANFLTFFFFISSCLLASNLNASEVSSEIEEVEKLINATEINKAKAQEIYAKDVGDILSNTNKIQNSGNYQASAAWIKQNKDELFAKQAKALPTIDYNLNTKTNAKNNAKSTKLDESNLNNDAIAKLLKNYRFKPKDIQKNQLINYPLMIFVSASIPKSALKDLMIQARKAGGVLVFRGLIGGSLKNTQQFLGNLAKENTSAIIDPRLFETFNVDLVPTFVVLNKTAQDCQNSNCNFTPIHDRIIGNITLNYALEQIANKNGDAKANAAEILRRIEQGQGKENQGKENQDRQNQDRQNQDVRRVVEKL